MNDAKPVSAPTVMPEPAVPRPAASLLLLRERTQVLMGMRGAGHSFMPNRLVFPGGAVDAADRMATVARPLPHLALATLAAEEDAELAHGIGVAAARELEEETGLSLGEPPDLSGMVYLCRAITPGTQPKRFDARFLVVDAAAATGVLAGSGELEDLGWYAIGAALALDLAHATRSVLMQLQRWMAQPEGWRVPVMRERVWT
jgi:8-oxo-dGTP pyrophosphatase MutT (NUDIX family)